jgi:hypothetical protein
MKTFTLKLVPIFLFGIFLINSYGCKKTPFDYRNKYVGDWDITTKWSSFNMLDSTRNHGQYSYVGEVWYDDEGKIKIKCSDSQTYDFDISEEGKLSILGFNAYGEFRDDNNLEFYVSSGGMGGGTSSTVVGIKN